MQKKIIKQCIQEVEKDKNFIFLKIITLLGYCSYLFFIRMSDYGYKDIFYNDISIPLIGVTISSFPMILYFSIILKQRAKSDYLLFNSPSQNKSLIFSKICSMLIPLFVLILAVGGLGLGLIILVSRFHGYEGVGFLIRYLLFIVSSTIFISGLQFLTESFYHSLKFFKGVAAFFFFFCTQTLVLWSFKFILMGEVKRDLSKTIQFGPFRINDSLPKNMDITNVYLFFIGFLLLIATMISFKKLKEV